MAFVGTSATLKDIFDEAEVAGRAFGVQISRVIVRDENELVRAFSATTRAHVG